MNQQGAALASMLAAPSAPSAPSAPREAREMLTSLADLGESLPSLLLVASRILAGLASCIALVLVVLGAFMTITGRFVAFTHPRARSVWRSPQRFGGIQVLMGTAILMLAGSAALPLYSVFRLVIAGLAVAPFVAGVTLLVTTLRATGVVVPEERDVPPAR